MSHDVLARTSSAARRADLRQAGASVVIVAYVATQFVDLTLGTVGDFVISAQKIGSALVLPIGIITMRRLRMPLTFVGLAGLLTMAFCAAPVLTGASAAALTESVSALLLNFLAACALLTALTLDRANVRLFQRAWITAAAVSAVVAIGQTVGLIPLFAVGEETLSRRATETGLLRASAFKYDPNFAAMMLVVGLVFVRMRRRTASTGVLTVLLMAGIAVTWSRMGLLVALAALVVVTPTALSRSRAASLVPKLAMGVVVLTGAALVLQASSAGVRQFVLARFADVGTAVATLFGSPAVGGPTTSSGVERAELLTTTTRVIADNWQAGVGPQNLQPLLLQLLGVDKGAHNTYVEILAIGGVFAVPALVCYVVLVTRSLTRARAIGDVDDLTLYRGLRFACLALAVMALTLTLIYNSVFLLPAVLALTARELAAVDVPSPRAPVRGGSANPRAAVSR